jgi:hypothetical protein
MKKDNNILEEDIGSLFNYSKIQTVMNDSRKKSDTFQVIGNKKFVIVIRVKIGIGYFK